MNNSVCVNARFRHQRMTGVQRYAEAVLSRLPSGVNSFAPASPRLATGVLGHIWEQTRLPSLSLGRLLWSPCNTGPLGLSRHVITIHDTAFVDCPMCFSPRFRRWYQWLIPRLVKTARHILTVSRFSASRLMAHYGVAERDISVIPNGVDERFRPASADAQARVRAKYNLPRDFVLTLGSLDPRKNLRRVLKACQSDSALRDVALVVVGGRSTIFASDTVNSEATGIQFLDFVPDQDLPALYSAASVFVYASLYEGFGLPPLEAMACRTPTVVAATTALPEAVGDAAMMVDPECHEHIAHGIRRVLEDSRLRAALSRKGIVRADQFGWDTTADRVWHVLCSTD